VNKASGRILEDERKPLPTQEQPFAARMVTPKGFQLRLMLTMLYAAQCAVGPGKQWDTPYPVESCGLGCGRLAPDQLG
jgi:hypothetical protein